jgi:2-oxoglutarate dehydrogenase E2 component (dihydrolipoamide succinyltransferase)
MGEGIEELTVVTWLKKEGDTVKEFEVVVELETDKVSTEIPSPEAGTLLKILAQKDEVVKVGSTLAWIGAPGEVLEGAAPTPKAVVSTEAPEPAEASVTAEVVPATKAVVPAAVAKPDGAAATVVAAPVSVEQEYSGHLSPLVKKLAAENKVDLNLVRGTGKDGRITKEDVLNYLESGETVPTAEKVPASNAPPASGAVSTRTLTGTLIPHSSLRKQIAERMVNSQHTSPHVLTVMEADLSKVVAHRTANKEALAEKGVNLTLTAYFCVAIVNALQAFPDVNSSWTDEGIQRYNTINLGMAVSLGEAGLIVPVIKDAGSLSLEGLAQQIKDLADRARTKKLLPEDVKDGTFTLTNHGSGGSIFASPIIYQPQAAILGTGMMQKQAVVVKDASGNDAIAIRPMIYLSLVFDHRILDGEGADNFLKKIKEVLENWS